MKQFSEATRAQKEHYDLRRGKARTKRTEILYIFFGIHTANMVQFGGQDRTKGAFGGCLTLKLAVNAEFLWGNCILAMKDGQKNPAETTGNRYRTEILMSRTQKLKGLVTASLILKTLNDNP